MLYGAQLASTRCSATMAPLGRAAPCRDDAVYERKQWVSTFMFAPFPGFFEQTSVTTYRRYAYMVAATGAPHASGKRIQTGPTMIEAPSPSWRRPVAEHEIPSSIAHGARCSEPGATADRGAQPMIMH